MTEELQKNLDIVNATLSEEEIYEHACHGLNFDQETICPVKAMEEQGEVNAFLSNKAFALKKSPAFIAAAEFIYTHRDGLGEFDRTLAEALDEEHHAGNGSRIFARVQPGFRELARREKERGL